MPVSLLKGMENILSVHMAGLYAAQILIEKDVQNFWKLKAIDSILSSGLTIEEQNKIIERMIIDNDLRDVLLGRKNDKDIEQEVVAQ